MKPSIVKSKTPPVTCGGCGREIAFEPGQLVGDPDVIARVKEICRVFNENYLAPVPERAIPAELKGQAIPKLRALIPEDAST
jgi:hypothetical protein